MIRAIPLAVLTLAIAQPADAARRTSILCGKSAGSDEIEQVKPRRCSTVAPGESLAEGLTYQRLTWRRWGKPRAYATGVIRPKVYDTTPVRIVAYRKRKVCRGSHYRYTRMRVSLYGRTNVERFSERCVELPARAGTLTVTPWPLVAEAPFVVTGSGWEDYTTVDVSICTVYRSDDCDPIGTTTVRKRRIRVQAPSTPAIAGSEIFILASYRFGLANRRITVPVVAPPAQ